MEPISRAELAEALKAGKVTVVDALPAAPFANRHLPGALNLTIEEIADVADVLPDKAAAVVTYSTDASCTRGPELAEALTAAGYGNVRVYTDGITDWAAAGLPLESGTTAEKPSEPSTATDSSDDHDAVRALVRQWAELERTQDADGLQDLLTERFTGIGPVGFVLDARQWADRHRGGDLVNHAFDVTDVQIATYGDTAVVHAVETQRATARGHDNNGSFRAGLTLIRGADGWKIAHLQLSGPMIQPTQKPPGT